MPAVELKKTRIFKFNHYLSSSLLLFVVATFVVFSFKTHTKKNNYLNVLEQIIHQCCQEFQINYGLNCYGQGGSFMDCIKKIALSLRTDQQVSIEEARILIVRCQEALLNKINSEEKIRSYLVNYPFKSSELDISISFYEHRHKRTSPDHIARVMTVFGYTFYEIYDETTDLFEIILKEPYEKALIIATDSTNS